VINRSQYEESRGDKKGTGTISCARAVIVATVVSISRYERTSGPPRSNVSPTACGCPSTSQSASSASVKPIGWQRGVHPARGDHHRQALDQLHQDLPADAAVTDDDACPQDGFELAAAPEVRRELVVGVAEAAEVDDLPHTGPVGGGSERASSVPVPRREVRTGEGMDEVVPGVHAGQCLSQTLGVGDVTEDAPPRPGTGLRTPGSLGPSLRALPTRRPVRNRRSQRLQ
jgi:hypothetical protein